MEGGGLSKEGSPEDSAARRARECHLCRFCERGFTTAQALGGHMNVHRRREAEAEAPAAPPAAAQVDGSRGAGGSEKAGPGGKGEVDLELRLWF
ncbi:hypothetical protein ZWY2020_001616 [Hordeum vulgare]|nr:hypothetical protein ZWY2020_001616 [Hordeum vulgare]